MNKELLVPLYGSYKSMEIVLDDETPFAEKAVVAAAMGATAASYASFGLATGTTLLQPSPTVVKGLMKVNPALVPVSLAVVGGATFQRMTKPGATVESKYGSIKVVPKFGFY